MKKKKDKDKIKSRFSNTWPVPYAINGIARAIALAEINLQSLSVWYSMTLFMIRYLLSR